MLKSATLLFAALAVANAAPAPQGVTEVIAPLGQIPEGCSVSSPKTFGFYISSMPGSAASRKVERQVAQIEDVRIPAHANPKPAVPSSSSESAALFSADFEFEPATASSTSEAPSSSSAVRGGVAQLLDGQIQTVIDVAPSPVVRPAEDTLKTSIYRFSSYIKPISNYLCPSSKTTTTAERVTRPADCPRAHVLGGGVTQSTEGQSQAPATLEKRQNGSPLSVTLNNGVLTDSQGRTGYIADNRQFQFDAPAQAGAIYTGGFSVCDDGTLALGGNKQFWACGSSDFNNLYDQEIFKGGNCQPVYINIV